MAHSYLSLYMQQNAMKVGMVERGVTRSNNRKRFTSLLQYIWKIVAFRLYGSSSRTQLYTAKQSVRKSETRFHFVRKGINPVAFNESQLQFAWNIAQMFLLVFLEAKGRNRKSCYESLDNNGIKMIRKFQIDRINGYEVRNAGYHLRLCSLQAQLSWRLEATIFKINQIIFFFKMKLKL